MKCNQHLDPLLTELKELVLNKLNESFSRGGDDLLRYKGRLCIPDVDDLRRKLLEEAHGFDILFIRVPTKCIVIF